MLKGNDDPKLDGSALQVVCSAKSLSLALYERPFPLSQLCYIAQNEHLLLFCLVCVSKIEIGKVFSSPGNARESVYRRERITMRYTLVCLPLCLLCTSDSSSTEPPQAAAFREVVDKGHPLPSEAGMEHLAKNDPIAFLRECILRYDREVTGYTATLQKQERIDGRLERTELIDVAFREKPFSVLMKWKEGARRAAAVLYVKGENRDQLLVRPAGVLSVAGIVARSPNGSDAKKAGRYPLTEFGIKIGMQRTLVSWERAKRADALHVEFLGVKEIKETGNRPCWILKRTGYAAPEESEGITELTTYIDKDTWLQVGTVLKGEDNRLIGEYFFRDITINPTLPAGTFTPNSLKR